MSWEWVALIFFLIIDPTTTLNEITGETLGILPVILMFIVFVIIRELWASLRSGLSADRQRKEKEKEQRLDFSGNEVKGRVEKDRTNEGRRVELIYTSNPRTSLKPGDRGKYEWVYKYPSSRGNQHFIRWDNGSGMILIDGKDSFKFVDEEKE